MQVAVHRESGREFHSCVSAFIVWSRILLVAAMLLLATRGGAQSIGDDDLDPPPGPEDLGGVPGVLPYSEYGQRLHAAEQVSPLASTAFGDSVNLYNGQTEFNVVDIDIPGNSALPVQLRRRFSITAVSDNTYVVSKSYGGIGNWDVDVPYISGTFDGAAKWDVSENGTTHRCSEHFSPGYGGGNAVQADIWTGNTVHIPGQGDKSILTLAADGPRPTELLPEKYHWTTRDFDVLSCTDTVYGHTGEGFIMYSPDGLVYTFNKYVEQAASPVTSGPPGNTVTRARVRIYLLATKVEDQFGNWVQYEYTTSGYPKKIWSNDGRQIDLNYITVDLDPDPDNEDVVHLLDTATAHGDVWHYDYTTETPSSFSGPEKVLEFVILPDGSKWTYEAEGSLHVHFPAPGEDNSPVPGDLGTAVPDCPIAPVSHNYALTITHPAGSSSKFEFDIKRIKRSGVPKYYCAFFPMWGGGQWYLYVPYYSTPFGLTKKTIWQPGEIEAYGDVWQYNYGTVAAELWDTPLPPPGEEQEPCPISVCQAQKVVTVTNPDGTKKEYDFGVMYLRNEGKLFGTRDVSATGTVVRSEVTQYLTDEEAAGEPFADTYGGHWGGDHDPTTIQIRPIRNVTITQDGAIFARENFLTGELPPYPGFDEFARPQTTRRLSFISSMLSRIDVTAYHDDEDDWVLGQIGSVHEITSNTWPVENTYTSLAQLQTEEKFGQLQWTLGYDTDGTLKTVKDGNNHTTTLTNYKRGVPKDVDYAISGQDQHAEVDDFGRITSVTDEMGYTTTYGYDDVGRLKSIAYPAGDTPAWNTTTRHYYFGAEVDLSSGCDSAVGEGWRGVERTGAACKIVYYDGLMRPILTDEYDNTSGFTKLLTRRFVKRSFDWASRATFVSYPSPFTSPLTGTSTTYDAIDRPIQITADSELGSLITDIDYLAPFKKRVTDPNGNVTTTSYQAFDTPTYDFPAVISAPEGQTTTIDRDLFGKPEHITRSGTYGGNPVSLTRDYFYDTHERLCKTLDPESGATIQGYDGAGNVVWNVKGTNWNGTSCTGVAANQRTTFTYDARNRLLSTTFPAASNTSSITNTYYPDGALETTTTNGATWTYDYNRRRLLESESLAYDGKLFQVGWTYHPNGFMEGVIYPDGTPVAYLPNALGQPTRAGDFASDVAYWKNGAMYGFTYGNGIVHRMDQNTRLLPAHSWDAGVTDLSYAYDENANVLSITDNLPGNVANRTMEYDGLNRLTRAVAPGLWGTTIDDAHFAYDPLDNLRVGTVPPRHCTYNYDGVTNRLTGLTGPSCGTIYTYDPRGNVASRTKGVTTQSFDFDYANRLTEVTDVESYEYDGLGHRIRIENEDTGAKRYQIYSQSGQLLYSEDADGTKVDYIYLNGSLIARNEGGPSGMDLPAPGNFTVSPNPSTTGYYTVSWDAVTGAGSYRLMQSTNGGAYVPIYPGLATSWSPESAQPSGNYSYYVEACDTVCGADSPTIVEVVNLPLGAPNPIEAAPNPSPDGDYTVSWAAVAGAIRYRLEEREGTTGSWDLAQFGPGTSKTYTNKPQGTYQYRAQACSNTTGTVCGPYSSTETVTVQGGGSDDPPHAPLALSVSPSPSLDGDYTVSWGESLTATEYNLEEQFGSGGWVPVGNPLDPNLILRSWSPNPPKTVNGVYTYRVNACNQYGCSDWANSQPSVTVDVFPPPATVWAMPNSVQVPLSGPPATYKIKWDAVPGATYYEVKRHDSCGGPIWYDPVDYSASPAQYNAYIPAGCTNSADFYYSVRACKTNRCSDWSGLPEAKVRVTHGQIDLTGTLQTTYLHTDALGSVVAETDEAGVATHHHYEPYGAPTDQTYTQEPGYTGHVMDEKTGLIYMQQRYYDPLRGGFLSVDPVAASAGGFNRYAYANNNPYKNVDPDGRCPTATGTHICPNFAVAMTQAANVQTARNVEQAVQAEVAKQVDSMMPKSTIAEFGGSAQGGTATPSASTQASVGTIIDDTKTPRGAYLSVGVMVAGEASSISFPGTKPGSLQFVAGASADFGISLGITNAETANQFNGPSSVVRLATPLGTVQASYSSSGIWTLSAGLPAAGISFSKQELQTWGVDF